MLGTSGVSSARRTLVGRLDRDRGEHSLSLRELARLAGVAEGAKAIPGCDKDLLRGLTKIISKRYKAIHLKTKVSAIKAQKNGLKVTFEGDKAPAPALFNKVR